MKLFLKATLILLPAIFLFLGTLCVTSCQKQQEELNLKEASNRSEPPVGFKYQGKPMILGKKLENPYSIEVMSKAQDNIRKNLSKNSDSIPVRTTHLYVRFLPPTWMMFDSLKKDKSLELYDYPLDYEIATPGEYYHDSLIPVGHPTYYYAAVPVNYSFLSGIPYQILAHLYIPEEDKRNTSLNGGTEMVDLLLKEAMRLTHNTSSTNPSTTKRSKYIPRGTVFVYDSRVQRHIPLEGAKIRMRQWFCTYTRLVDRNGNFSMNESFRNNVNYSLVYEDPDFDIRSGMWGQAVLCGPNSNTTWHVSIGPENTLQKFYAHAFKAAFEYYHFNNRFNINPPPQPWWYDVKIGVYDEFAGVNGDYAHWRHWLTLSAVPDIRVYMKRGEGYNYREDFEVYSTTIHELAHAVHRDLDGAFRRVEDNVSESWARVVQWTFTNDAYNRLGLTNFDFSGGWQALNSSNQSMKRGYTPLFIDLIDDFNQRAVFGDNSFPPDNVTGFTLNDIQNALSGSRNFSTVRDKLIALNRAPRADMDALFNYYINDVVYE